MQKNILKIEIVIEGKTLAGVSSITISQWIDRHHEFMVALPFEAIEKQDSLSISTSQKWVGKEIIIESTDKVQKGGTLKFKGIVTKVVFLKDSTGGRSLELRGFSSTVLLEQGGRFAAFYQKDIAQIANKTLSESNRVKADINPQNNIQLHYYVKYNESNFAFLKRLALQSGNWFFYDGTKVVFGSAPGGAIRKLNYREELFHFELQVNYPDGEFQMKEWDYTKSHNFEVDSKAVSVKGLGKYGQDALKTASSAQPSNPYMMPETMAWNSQSALKDQMQFRKKNAQAEVVMMSGSSGQLSLKIGDLIQIEERDFSTLNSKKTEDLGNYRIIQLHHYIGRDGHYHNSFTAIPADVEFFVSLGYVLPHADTQIAKVVDNKDPDKLGRVRVIFLWQSFQNDKEPSPWLPVLMSHVNGKTPSGTYFVPEKEDMVTVIFENGDPTRPIVVGGIHHKNVQPTDFVHDQNYYKVIATRSGNQIFISDEPGKEEIRIYNKDKKNKIILSLDDPHIAIESSGTLDLKARTIKMTADKMEFKVANDWTIESSKTQLNNKQSVKISAGSEIDISGNGQVSIESKSQTKVKGGGQLSLEGGGEASLKAGIVRIN